MGSYSAPVQIWHYERVTVDLNTLTNEVVLGPKRCGNFMALMASAVGFDGHIRVEVLDTSDSWITASCEINNVEQTVNIAGGDLRIQNTVFIAEYPYMVRVICLTPPTIATARIYMTWIDPPANPLF